MRNVINFPTLTESLVKRARVIDVNIGLSAWPSLNNHQWVCVQCVSVRVCVCVQCVVLYWVCFAVTSHVLYGVCLRGRLVVVMLLAQTQMRTEAGKQLIETFIAVNCVGDWNSFIQAATLYRRRLSNNNQTSAQPQNEPEKHQPNQPQRQHFPHTKLYTAVLLSSVRVGKIDLS